MINIIQLSEYITSEWSLSSPLRVLASTILVVFSIDCNFVECGTLYNQETKILMFFMEVII